MKKNILILGVIAVIGITAGWNTFYNNQEQEIDISNLTLANIEALAGGESGNCSDSCKEWKGNSGGGIACDCGRYTGTCKNRC